jgi:hypothetical protein
VAKETTRAAADFVRDVVRLPAPARSIIAAFCGLKRVEGIKDYCEVHVLRPLQALEKSARAKRIRGGAGGEC